MILDSEKLNPQYNQNSVSTMPPPLATGLHAVVIQT